ncbi:MAG: gamma-glutamylcyclotransferase [Candidatus Binatia bacterium]
MTTVADPTVNCIDSEWIFGYGSLLWKQDFPFEEARPAFIRDWERRFWQGSTDHRGLPEAPGRVVTLVRSIGAVCRGLAFRLRSEERDLVLAHLDHRERDGYRRIRSELFVSDEAAVPGLFYIADETNPSFLGPAPVPDIVEQVRAASGASGPNIDYVCRLAQSLRELAAHDPHVFDLEDRLLLR